VGSSLLVKGPAAVTPRSGRMSVFAADLPLDKRIIVPEGRMIPVTANAEGLVEVIIGSLGSIFEVEGPTIPEDWVRIPPSLKETLRGDGMVIILGGVDSGKSSLSTFISNYFTSRNLQVSILDLDVGQSDIGLPATIGLGIARDPIMGLYEAETTAMYFIGSISPAPMTDKIIKGARKLAEKARVRGSVTIVNTDGWLQGEEALSYKMRLIDALKPDAAIIIGEGEEEGSLAEMLKGEARVLKAGRPRFIYRRTREERKRIREKAYYRYLRGGTLGSFPLSRVEWNRLDFRVLPSRNVNLLAGLIDGEGLMRSPGILKRIDLSEDMVLIYSRGSYPVERIEVGLVRLKENGCEIGQIRLDRGGIEEGDDLLERG
jgi:polynucleotide 5'-hydroxyl-kinase GRC3/NOL9